jgi:hypothetical protein
MWMVADCLNEPAGKRHRVGSPAVTLPGGEYEWWLEGVRYPTELGYEMALMLFYAKAT